MDPKGLLELMFEAGHFELKDLSEEKNIDHMMGVVSYVLPKFKSLTSMQKRKLEKRIELLSTIIKEIQKSSEDLSAAMSSGQ